MANTKRIAVLWLTPENYHRAVALSDEAMPTYEDWRKKVDRLIGELPADIEAVRVEADPDVVAKWCRANFGKVTAQSRSAFAADYLKRKMQH